MSTLAKIVRNLLLGATFGVALATPVLADDAEIFVSRPDDVGARPNILFIVDTSGSMDTCVPSGRQPPCLATDEGTRLQIVRDGAINLTNSLDNVNLGLMRYSSNAQGGMVIEAVDNIANNRTTILNRLNTFTPTFGNGNTPLSETLYEAALYLKGQTAKYGSVSSPEHSTPASLVDPSGWQYKSPIEFQCQKSYIVYLTDGEPTSDNDANTDIESMIGHTCNGPSVGGSPAGNGRCTDDLAGYLASTSTDLSNTQAGNQNALTYMIGFGDDILSALPYLNSIASAGGTGAAYTAADANSLSNTLETIFTDIDNRSQTFTTPSISVNAFNRTQTGADLFFSLFRVEDTEHWNGNLKKYKLLGSTIVDANNAPAVTSGFFSAGSTSIWSATQDGAAVTEGGAVSRLDAPDNRNLYTYTGGTRNLAANANALTVLNTSLKNSSLGLVPANDPAELDVGLAGRVRAISWARGYPNGVPVAGTQNKFMGDPVHGQAAVVTYGGTAANPDTMVYVPTNDGFLHAIKGTSDISSGGGQEQWAFIPPELLHRLKDLANITAAAHTYGLDGDVQVLKHDANHDGVVNGSDFVWLIFGMRMGGHHYYALDVTDPSQPKLKWSIGPAELPGLGQTWSTPVITKVDTTTNTEAHKYVVIFGGGYDIDQDRTPPSPYATDDEGNHIFMVDADTGAPLWSAGKDSGTLQLPQMTNSIPSRITVIDTNNDGFADRMYVGDMGGRIWRFDIFNGASGIGLVTGGVIASLGGAAPGANATSDNRRFYNAPDVSLIQRRGAEPYYNIAIGSGYRGHPLDTYTHERFYAVRDKSPYSKLSQSDYNTLSLAPILNSDLVNITADPANAVVLPAKAGWTFDISDRSGRAGEKILAEATTVNGVVLFPSFQPGFTTAQSANNPCYPVNTNRVYALSVDTGRPALDFNDDGTTDLSSDLNQTGIVGQINVGILNDASDPTDSDNNGIPDALERGNTICLAGVEVLSKCVGVGGTVRTFWRRNTN